MLPIYLGIETWTMLRPAALAVIPTLGIIFFLISMIPLCPILFVFAWALLALTSLFKGNSKKVALAAV